MSGSGHFLDVRRIIKSVGYAVRGIQQMLRTEPNARIHLLATVIVITMGFLLRVSLLEWVALCIVIGLVWVGEAINTAIEKLTDMVTPDLNPKAAFIKDVAAGAVLICSIVAIITGLIIFIPKIMNFSFISTLEKVQIPCIYKCVLGIDCPGCGMQRSFIALLKGNLSESFKLYPALLPTIALMGMLVVHLLFKPKRGWIILKCMFIIDVIIILISYLYKLFH